MKYNERTLKRDQIPPQSAEQEQRRSNLVGRAVVARGQRGDDHAADGPRPAEPGGADLLALPHLRGHVSHLQEDLLQVR